jgi:hypothetical protein
MGKELSYTQCTDQVLLKEKGKKRKRKKFRHTVSDNLIVSPLFFEGRGHESQPREWPP